MRAPILCDSLTVNKKRFQFYQRLMGPKITTDSEAIVNDERSREASRPIGVNRKLIRPSLNEIKDQMSARPRRKPAPPDSTNAENFYYVKQMQSRTPMVVVLQDGEEIRGVIEWYDKHCIKVNRINEPNLLLYKANIKYLYKEHELKTGGNGSI